MADYREDGLGAAKASDRDRQHAPEQPAAVLGCAWAARGEADVWLHYLWNRLHTVPAARRVHKAVHTESSFQHYDDTQAEAGQVPGVEPEIA